MLFECYTTRHNMHEKRGLDEQLKSRLSLPCLLELLELPIQDAVASYLKFCSCVLSHMLLTSKSFFNIIYCNACPTYKPLPSPWETFGFAF